MTLQECFETIQADYNGVMGRLMTEERVVRFLIKFLDDSSYTNLMEALAGENYEDAFRAAHNMKGVCQNLGITGLGNAAGELCEVLRGGTPSTDPMPLAAIVDAEYEKTICAVRELAVKE